MAQAAAERLRDHEKAQTRNITIIRGDIDIVTHTMDAIGYEDRVAYDVVFEEIDPANPPAEQKVGDPIRASIATISGNLDKFEDIVKGAIVQKDAGKPEIEVIYFIWEQAAASS